MAPQCAARFTMTLALKEKPFITFQCEREAHEDGKHFTTGKGPHGTQWTMSWVLPLVNKGGK